MPGNDPKDWAEEESGLATARRPATKSPRLYKVVIHNDDYTTMEFVIEVLMRFFAKGQTEAVEIMWSVHTKGQGICGVFTREVAETKVTLVADYAKQHEMPLKCTMEPE